MDGDLGASRDAASMRSCAISEFGEDVALQTSCAVEPRDRSRCWPEKAGGGSRSPAALDCCAHGVLARRGVTQFLGLLARGGARGADYERPSTLTRIRPSAPDSDCSLALPGGCPRAARSRRSASRDEADDPSPRSVAIADDRTTCRRAAAPESISPRCTFEIGERDAAERRSRRRLALLDRKGAKLPALAPADGWRAFSTQATAEHGRLRAPPIQTQQLGGQMLPGIHAGLARGAPGRSWGSIAVRPPPREGREDRDGRHELRERRIHCSHLLLVAGGEARRRPDNRPTTVSKRFANDSCESPGHGRGSRVERVSAGSQTRAERFATRIGNRATVPFPPRSEAATSTT